jgi:hypothetical protein
LLGNRWWLASIVQGFNHQTSNKSVPFDGVHFLDILISFTKHTDQQILMQLEVQNLLFYHQHEDCKQHEEYEENRSKHFVGCVQAVVIEVSKQYFKQGDTK